MPCEDNYLRRVARERPSCRIARYERLPLDIERQIAAIIEKEIELVRRLDTLKRDLEIRYDFSPYAAFKAIDRYNEGAINTNNLSLFLRNQGCCPTEREVLAIIRRMDTSCAAAVSYTDFADFMRNHGSADLCSSDRVLPRARSAGRYSICDTPTKKLLDSTTKRPSSANRTTGKKKACCDDCSNKGSSCGEKKPRSPCKPDPLCAPLYTTVCYGEYPYRRCYNILNPCYPSTRVICDPCLPVRCDPCLPVRCDPCPPVRCDPCPPVRRYNPCSPVRVCDPCLPVRCSPCKPALSAANECDLTKALYDMIREERDLESAKINLSKRCDFNLYDAFRIFDTCNRGYITLADLREGLSAIGVYPTTSDMELYIKRYDRFNEGKVRFSEFSESFTPKTDTYASSSLNRRSSNVVSSCCKFGNRDDCFDAGTRIEFRSAWNTHFKVEAMCEGIRQRLRALPCFDLYSAFLTCDLYNDGVISKDELRRLIDCRGFYVTDTDAQQLVNKIDKDRDGVVSYSEVRIFNSPNLFSAIVQRRA